MDYDSAAAQQWQICIEPDHSGSPHFVQGARIALLVTHEALGRTSFLFCWSCVFRILNWVERSSERLGMCTFQGIRRGVNLEFQSLGNLPLYYQ